MRGRVALVTGASSGIGRAVAIALANRGASVWLVGRRADALAETAAATNGAAVHTRALDLTDDTELAGLHAELESEGQGLDAVVHCAGTIALGRLEDSDPADLDAQYRANLRAPYLLTQALLPLLRARRGDVVFINSTAGLAGRPETAQYSATKAALRAVADSLRHEINSEGVRVLSVFPGSTATPTQERIHEHKGREYRPELLMQPEDIADMVVAAVSLPRTIEVTEMTMRPFVKPA